MFMDLESSVGARVRMHCSEPHRSRFTKKEKGELYSARSL